MRNYDKILVNSKILQLNRLLIHLFIKMGDMRALKKWNQIFFITPWWQVAVQVHPQWKYSSHLRQPAKWQDLDLKYVSFTFAWQKTVFIHDMNFSYVEEPLAQKCTLREMSRFAVLSCCPLTDVFIAVQFCFSESEMDVKKGDGLHINLFSHPFHSSKRLRL